MNRRAARLPAAFWGSLALGLALAATPCPARNADFDLTGYQGNDGAITVRHRGDFVDPYFAIKALLTARELGLNDTAQASRWIAWVLARPASANGPLGRYCRAGQGTWQECRKADADDAVLALWLELLYLSAPAGAPLPPAWQKSADQSLAALLRLYDPDLGGFIISPTERVALLMDNCEVIAALRVVADQKRARGQAAAARRLRRQADLIERRLARLFPPKADGLLRHTSQDEADPAFYPHAVAQLYPLLGGLDSLLHKPAIGYPEWMRRYRHAWLTLSVDHYPWGLVAQAAFRQHDRPSVVCWVRQAAPLRHGDRWNVLEDALWQGLSGHVNPDMPCSPF